MSEFKVGDWVVFDMKIGQIKEIRDGGSASFSDGSCETSGRLMERFRPLTLQNKRFAEDFDILYRRLYEIDGNSGFNFPHIHSLFSEFVLQAIDGDDARAVYDKAIEFIAQAREYKTPIHGVALFRPQRRARA